jgi:hypothetical protein
MIIVYFEWTESVLATLGALQKVVKERKEYRDVMEGVLTAYVLPEFQSPLGFMRARACWMMQQYSWVKFVQVVNLQSAVNCVLGCLRYVMCNCLRCCLVCLCVWQCCAYKCMRYTLYALFSDEEKTQFAIDHT